MPGTLHRYRPISQGDNKLVHHFKLKLEVYMIECSSEQICMYVEKQGKGRLESFLMCQFPVWKNFFCTDEHSIIQTSFAIERARTHPQLPSPAVTIHKVTCWGPIRTKLHKLLFAKRLTKIQTIVTCILSEYKRPSMWSCESQNWMAQLHLPLLVWSLSQLAKCQRIYATTANTGLQDSAVQQKCTL